MSIRAVARYRSPVSKLLPFHRITSLIGERLSILFLQAAAKLYSLLQYIPLCAVYTAEASVRK